MLRWDDPPASRPWIIAHRGDHRRFTENTLEAFESAFALGADGVELDVRQCASGQLVVFHDVSLERLAGDTRKIAEITWEELQNIELDGGEKIPLLADVLELSRKCGKLVNIELKVEKEWRALEWRLYQELELAEDELLNSVLISSFHPKILLFLSNHFPRLRCGLLCEDNWLGKLSLYWYSRRLSPYSIHLPQSMLTPSRLRKLASFRLMSWGIRSVEALGPLSLAAWIVDDIEESIVVSKELG